jgi:hypothetical protein
MSDKPIMRRLRRPTKGLVGWWPADVRSTPKSRSFARRRDSPEEFVVPCVKAAVLTVKFVKFNFSRRVLAFARAVVPPHCLSLAGRTRARCKPPQQQLIVGKRSRHSSAAALLNSPNVEAD